MNLELKTTNYNFSGEFSRRITVIKGDSATGKSSLVELLTTRSPLVKVTCDLNIITVNDSNWEGVLRTEKDAIIFFDDLTCVEAGKFAKICKERLVKNNLYVVLISRARLTSGYVSEREIGELIDSSKSFEKLYSTMQSYEKAEKSEKSIFSKLPISVKEMYVMKNNGKTEHWLEPMYQPEPFKPDEINGILTEDSGTGFRFFNNYFCNVEHAENGKSMIIRKALDMKTEGIKLVLFDSAGFGGHYEEFCQKCLKDRHDFAVCLDYECFEQFILESNYFRDNLKKITEFQNLPELANNFVSWESYFQKLVENLTKDSQYEVTHTRHSKLSDCYLKDCDFCDVWRKSKCNIQCNDKKLQWMFSRTIFDFITRLTKIIRSKSLLEQTISDGKQNSKESPQIQQSNFFK